MDDLDIDETLPGQEIEDESLEDTVRRESNSSSSSLESSSMNWDGDGEGHGWKEGESLRGWLYLIAGAGYSLLVVYLLLVIWNGTTNIPILSDGRMCQEDVSVCGYGALTTAILISTMVYVTMWFFMSGKKHSFFTDDPDKAKFYAGIIGLASLVIISQSWADYSREMVVSAILTSISSWSYIRSAQMKS
jgi:hypothetical protein